MTKPDVARSYLSGEFEGLGAFDFVALGPAGKEQNVVEVSRREDGGLEVRVPGRLRGGPGIPAPVAKALSERGFASDDPADPTRPWVRATDGVSAAVDLVLRLFVEVFEEKADLGFDVVHGSHRLEYEARKKLTGVRERLAKSLTDFAGRPPAQDQDGDFVLPVGDVHVTVAPRVAPDGPVVIRVFAITNVDVSVTPDLGLFLARLNFGLMCGRFALDAEHQAIWCDETLLGDQFRDEELGFTIRLVASTADEWDDRLKQMFGGATYQEVLTAGATREPPPSKPGDGGYL